MNRAPPKNKAIARLMKKREQLWEDIRSLQDSCEHPIAMVTKKHGSNTGNYDPSADCYWTDFYCDKCGRGWRQDGSV